MEQLQKQLADLERKKKEAARQKEIQKIKKEWDERR